MVWWWNSYRTKKMKSGVVLYTKPNKTKFVKEIKQNKIDRRLETKRVKTHTEK